MAPFNSTQRGNFNCTTSNGYRVLLPQVRIHLWLLSDLDVPYLPEYPAFLAVQGHQEAHRVPIKHNIWACVFIKFILTLLGF